MPEKETLARAQRARRRGKAPSTQASEFVREEMHHIREGKHGARSTKQAIAIGLSKARRAGVELPPTKNGKAATRKQASRDYTKGRIGAVEVGGSSVGSEVDHTPANVPAGVIKPFCSDAKSPRTIGPFTPAL